jgi:hypothetical protein
VGFFKSAILDKVEGGGKCMTIAVKREQIEQFLLQYQFALTKLKELVNIEKTGVRSANSETNKWK